MRAAISVIFFVGCWSLIMQVEINYPYPCRICCELCESAERSDFLTAYWRASGFPICKTHTKEERRKFQIEEAYECQLIDADCNDCKHFKRGARMLSRGDLVYLKDHVDKNFRAEGDYSRIVVQYDCFHGHCLKFDKYTPSFVNFATGHPCFEHRRD